MKFYCPIHFNGGNRGCEAISKGTSILLQEKRQNMLGLCSDMLLDRFLRLDSYVTLVEQKKDLNLLEKILRKFYYLFVKDNWRRKVFNYKYLYKNFIDKMTTEDILLSTGGDVFCYDDNQTIYTADYAHSKGIKTILWGCSMGEKNISKRKLQTLKNFDLIYARESLSEAFFKSLGLKNVCLFPDPAFILKPEKVNCEKYFSKNETIGLNLSEFVLGSYKLDKEFGVKVKELIDYILCKTNFDILLIPHVTWSYQDDNLVASNVKSLYSHNDRIKVVDTNEYNYCQLRYIISKCKIFIGGRTHAVISAYSTCVPAIAIGYSIKSKGIAKDLMLDDKMVVDSKCQSFDNQLLCSFKYVLENEEQIRTHMISLMPQYIKRLDNLHDYIINFINSEEKSNI